MPPKTSQTSFTNKDLDRFKPREEVAPISLRGYEAIPSSPAEPSLDELLSQAKATLAKSYGVVPPSAPEEPMAPAPRPSLRGALRGATDIMSGAAVAPGLASILPTPLSPVLGLTSAALAAPGALRKLLMPDADESRVMGAVETGLTALVAPWRGLKGATAAAPEAAEAVKSIPRQLTESGFSREAARKVAGHREIPYQSSQAAENPASLLKMVREVAAENDEDVASVIARSFRTDPGRRVPVMQLHNASPAARQADALRHVDNSQRAFNDRLFRALDDEIIAQERAAAPTYHQVGIDPAVGRYAKLDPAAFTGNRGVNLGRHAEGWQERVLEAMRPMDRQGRTITGPLTPEQEANRQAFMRMLNFGMGMGR